FSIYVNENSNDKHCCIYDSHKFFVSRHNIEPPPFGDGSHPADKLPNKIITEYITNFNVYLTIYERD
ncbi:hypothetical protein, partial [Hungatella effluvii]|uniref:hypothetical protein n=1 Tax=Hungatella effluvii TaxID=1096246 RepID=UPI002A7EEC4F